MNRRRISFQRMLLTQAGRRLLAGRAFVIALVAALLVIPTTCAQVSGPHSIFFDTTASHHHHDPTNETDGGFQSNVDLALHVTLGDGSPSWVLSDTPEAERDCPSDPSLRELPTTMEMGSASAPMTLEIMNTIEFPHLLEPDAIDEPALIAVIDPVESPPPR